MIDDTNCTSNYKRYLAHNIRQTIDNMSEHDKQLALESIQAETAFGNTPADTQTLQYVTSLLNGKQPPKGLARRRPQ